MARWRFDGYASACGATCPGMGYTNQIAMTSLVAVSGWMLLMVVIAAVALLRSCRTPPSRGGSARHAARGARPSARLKA